MVAATGACENRSRMKAESDKRYEAVVKHYREEVLQTAFFDDPDAAKRWLFRRWAAMPVHLDLIDKYCAAAIYDQQDFGKRVFTLGAAYLLDDACGDKRAQNR